MSPHERTVQYRAQLCQRGIARSIVGLTESNPDEPGSVLGRLVGSDLRARHRSRECVGATLYPLNCLTTAFTPTVLEPVCLFDVPRCRPFLTNGDPVQSFERVRILANQENQSRRLGIRLGAALFPLLEGAFVNPQLASENGS